MSAADINDRDIRKLAKRMERDGFEFRMNAKNHIRVFAPDGTYAGPLCSSPGTPRWELATLRSICRKWGVKP